MLHLIPDHPSGHRQKLRRAQVPPFKQNPASQTAETIIGVGMCLCYMCVSRFSRDWLYIPCSQVGPCQCAVQEHVPGSVHVPPFIQEGVQMAVFQKK